MWTRTVDLLPTDGVVVETKIDDENGVRNVQRLKRVGNLWWSGDMYVYYRPTHWRAALTDKSRPHRSESGPL